MTGTLDTLSNTDLEALKRELAELKRRVEQLEGESRVNRQQLAFLRGRMNGFEIAS